MKLLLYSHFFAPSIGGTETIVLSIANGLAGLRDPSGLAAFEVTLVTQTPAQDFNDRLLPFRVVRQPGFSQLWRLVSSNDVIHVAGPALSPLALGMILRKPVVIEHHGFQTICPTGQLLMERTGAPCPGHFMAGDHLECLRCRQDNNWRGSCKLWTLTFVRRFLCSRAAANIAPTEWLSGLLRLPRTIAIPHGLVEAAISGNQSRLTSCPPTVVFQGRLVSTKGIRVLLEAAAVLRSRNLSFELVVIGDGPERSALEEFAQEMQLSCVRFVGRLNAGELESTLAKADIVVVPSLGGEVFGLVVAENMSRGLPIVASDLGAFAEVLGDAGITFRTGDAQELAHQLARLLDDPESQLSLGTRARQRVLQQYPLNRMIEAHARLYHELCATNQP